VRKLVKKYGWTTVLKETIGYAEWLPYCTPLVQKIGDEIKANTWRFTKRQMTWFKKDKRIQWLDNRKKAEKLVGGFLKGSSVDSGN
jgi:tRNA dimethylallyltransferase